MLSAEISACRARPPSSWRAARCCRATFRPPCWRSSSGKGKDSSGPSSDQAPLALQQLELVRLTVPFLGVGGRFLHLGNHRPLLGQLCIELLEVLLPRG